MILTLENSSIVIFGSILHIVKNIRWQCVCMMAVSVTFCGALSTANSSNRNSAAAFSFLATFPAGVLELIPAMLVQMDADDADLGTVFCTSYPCLVQYEFRLMLGQLSFSQ